MPSSAFASGEAVGLAIKAALGPVLERQAVLMEKCTRLEAELASVRPELAALRERAAVLETRAPIPGPAGPAGTDGFTCDELTMRQDDDDERILTLGYRRGPLLKTLGQVRLAFLRYCGVYDAARVYTKGDQVTYNGSLWVCHAPTRSRPGGPEDGWTLQVKKGDGR